MNKSSLAREYRDKYGSEMPTKKLARIMYSEHPLLFSHLEDARTTLRYIEGKLSHKDIKKVKDSPYFMDTPRPLNPYNLPASDEKEYVPYVIEGPQRIAALFDVHCPYHSIEALTAALEWLREQKPTMLLIGGDFFDFYGLSRFMKDPDKRSPAEEIRIGVELLKALFTALQPQNVIFKMGNHDERFEHFLWQKMGEMSGLQDLEELKEITLENILRKRLGNKLPLDFVGDKRIIKAGSLNITHGHEFPSGIASPVNVARGLYMRAKANAICGHHHKNSLHVEQDINSQMITTWSVGCLCYSEDTEILTQDGFKFFKNVLDSDLIGVYDIESNSIRLSKPLARQEYDYHGEMVNFFDNKIDLLVTPEHKMIYKNHSGKNAISEAQSLAKSNGIYNYYSSAKFQSLTSFNSDLSELCAWIVTEGTIDYAKEKYPRISIYQKKEEPRLKLESLIQRLGIEFSVSIDQRNGVSRYRLSNESSREVIEKIWGGNFEKRIPRKILNSDYNVLSKVYETLIITDGHRRSDKKSQKGTDYLPTKDIDLANDYAEIAIKLGFTCYIKKEIRNTNYKKNSTIYLVRIRKSQVTQCRNVSFQNYTGKVYDFSSETGWLVVRRNGKVSISSNCDLHPLYMPINSWNHGVALITLDEEGNVDVQNKRIKNGRIM